MNLIVMVSSDDIVDIAVSPAFVSAFMYAKLQPMQGELGSISGMRFVIGPPTIEFVTTEEFVTLIRNPRFMRESPIQGRIYNTTCISLVPPGAV